MDRAVAEKLLGRPVKIFFSHSPDNVRIFTGHFTKIFETSVEFVDKYNQVVILDLDMITRVEVLP